MEKKSPKNYIWGSENSIFMEILTRTMCHLRLPQHLWDQIFASTASLERKCVSSNLHRHLKKTCSFGKPKRPLNISVCIWLKMLNPMGGMPSAVLLKLVLGDLFLQTLHRCSELLDYLQKIAHQLEKKFRKWQLERVISFGSQGPTMFGRIQQEFANIYWCAG